MKKYLPIFAIIALVVFVAGCVDSGTTNNTTSVDTTVPDVPSKTYAKNGISFKYPQSWSNQLEIQTPECHYWCSEIQILRIPVEI